MDDEIDLTDKKTPPKKNFKKATSCIWWLGGVGVCGKPLAEGDNAFCEKHRRVASDHRRTWERPL